MNAGNGMSLFGSFPLNSTTWFLGVSIRWQYRLPSTFFFFFSTYLTGDQSDLFRSCISSMIPPTLRWYSTVMDNKNSRAKPSRCQCKKALEKKIRGKVFELEVCFTRCLLFMQNVCYDVSMKGAVTVQAPCRCALQ